MTWICPFDSCNHEQITITRTNSNIMDTATRRALAIHLIKHVKNKYFGTTDFFRLLEEEHPQDIFTTEDEERYSTGGKKWKVNLRNMVNILKEEGYLDTDEIADIPDYVNEEFGTDTRKYRQRRRKQKFLAEFHDEMFEDWELYTVPEEAPPLEEEPKPDLSIDEMIKNYSLIGWNTICHLLLGRNVIFYGPPGTGKTRIAEYTARIIWGNNQYQIETAHAEWTAFDVIGGPTIEENSRLGFKPGFLTQVALANKWLIIDELNRANLDFAFGKIFTHLDIEYRKHPILSEFEIRDLKRALGREDDESINGCIPRNFRIIATMNTFDRAILFSLGYAFRRRFAFIEIKSPFEIVESYNYDFNPQIKEEYTKHLNGDGGLKIDLINNFKDEVTLKWLNEPNFLLEIPSLNFQGIKVKLIKIMKKLNETIDNFTVNPYKVALKLGEFLSTEKIISIGYSQPIDIIKYSLIRVSFKIRLNEPLLNAFLDNGNQNDEIEEYLIEGIDEAIEAYIIPQIEYYLPKARRLKLLGASRVTDGADALVKLQVFLLDLGLSKSVENLLKYIKELNE
ncbi:MAG: AAA family ATPase [Candidatus Odinarchaeota archaeon]